MGEHTTRMNGVCKKPLGAMIHLEIKRWMDEKSEPHEYMNRNADIHELRQTYHSKFAGLIR